MEKLIPEPENAEHKSGFINIIGRPNVGKSTLMNALVGERMSIITNKPQTTRHRIIGIINEPEYQLVFSDTPGMIDEPAYKMQEQMNRFAHSTFEDADVMLFVTEVGEQFADTVQDKDVLLQLKSWNDRIKFTESIPISALHQANTENLLQLIIDYLPEGPPYYPKDQFTDRSERFFVSEIVREKILLLYHQEIPYSVEVMVESFKETETKSGEPLVRIRAEIYVARQSQKGILIGKNGEAIKKLGTEARKGIEAFLEKKVFLELYVKVKDNWRDDEQTLKHFGYKD